ncbi:LexA family transcriptional regulator [Hymenobacter sp. 15J16-1T3B]|nr:LexA family transcriptional regulator [Hymenobacter sp. 15J16-1T3B]
MTAKRADRLTQLRLETGWSQRKISEKLKEAGLKVSAASLSAYEADDSIQIKRPVLRKLAELYGTTVEFIETGRHPAPAMKALPEDHPYGPLMSDKSNARFVALFDKKEMVYYRRLEVGARAGFSESFMSDYNYNELPLFPVIRMVGDPDEGLVVDIDGDSMEPQLRSGMKVLVEELPNVDAWKDARPGVYIVIFKHHFVIKRIKHNTLRSTGKVLLESDNPEGGVEEVIIDDIHGMWRVIRGVDVPIR